MTVTWRLILSKNNNGAWNMALDEALLKSAGTYGQRPTLRLYGWNPVTLSLGFAQSYKEVDHQRLSEFGWDLVRRPTGGRAILHTDELTYSITSPIDNPVLNGNLLESYRIISKALLASLNFLGVKAEGDKEYSNLPSSRPNPVCFETPSNYEITAGGRKLIGSAQARKYGGLLQHGSLPLSGDLTRIIKVLVYENEQSRGSAAAKLRAHATTLESLLNKTITYECAEEALINGFSSEFQIHFEKASPDNFELALADNLMKTKYSSMEWTQRI